MSATNPGGNSRSRLSGASIGLSRPNPFTNPCTECRTNPWTNPRTNYSYAYALYSSTNELSATNPGWISNEHVVY